MNPEHVLQEIIRSGVHLSADGDLLRWKCPASVMTDELKEKMRTYKPDLLRLLKRRKKPLVRVWRVKVDDGGKVSEMTFIDRECETLAGMTEYVRRIFPTFHFEIALQSEVRR